MITKANFSITLWVLSISIAVLLTGCVLPIPSTTNVSPAVSGVVRDAKTGAPIECASVVSARDRFSSSARSKSDGTYSVQSLRQIHYFMFLPYPFPLPARWTDVSMWNDDSPWSISVSAPGYDSYSVNRSFDFLKSLSWSEQNEARHALLLNGANIDFKLKPRP